VTARTSAAGGPPQLLVSVVEVRRRPGTRRPVSQRLEAHGLGLPDARVPEGAEISFEGEVESLHDGVVLTGVAEVPWEGECRRCLDPVAGVATVDVREVWSTSPADGEVWPLEHDHIDVGPLLRDLALLALPLAPLCGDACRGPAPEAFPATVEDDPALDDEAPALDPRWAALDDLDL